MRDWKEIRREHFTSEDLAQIDEWTEKEKNMQRPNSLEEIRAHARMIREGVLNKTMSPNAAKAAAGAIIAEARIIQEYRQMLEFAAKHKPDFELDMDILGVRAQPRIASVG